MFLQQQMPYKIDSQKRQIVVPTKQSIRKVNQPQRLAHFLCLPAATSKTASILRRPRTDLNKIYDLYHYSESGSTTRSYSSFMRPTLPLYSTSANTKSSQMWTIFMRQPRSTKQNSLPLVQVLRTVYAQIPKPNFDLQISYCALVMGLEPCGSQESSKKKLQCLFFSVIRFRNCKLSSSRLAMASTQVYSSDLGLLSTLLQLSLWSVSSANLLSSLSMRLLNIRLVRISSFSTSLSITNIQINQHRQCLLRIKQLIMNKNRTIRILILGDNKVGKTSFISTLISEVVDHDQKTLKPVVLPPNMCQFSTEVFTELIDTSQDLNSIRNEIQKGDLILLFYDISNENTIERLSDFWLPLISKNNNKIPIIIVGNKYDKYDLEVRNQLEYRPIKEIIRPLVKDYKQIQMGLQCSAFYTKNINSVLHCAQRAVLFPLTPLYNINNRELTDDFKKALTRIFRLLDKDMDGQLSDQELGLLQERVFDSELDAEDIRKIKEVVKIELETYDIDKISLKGFFTLHKKCIELLNIQICWSILRNFGYNDEIKLVKSHNKLIINEKSGSSVELKSGVQDFLTNIFQYYYQKYAHQQSSQKMLEEIFICTTNQIPVRELRNLKVKIDLRQFLMAFHYFAYTNYEKCFETLISIGFEGSLEDAFFVTNQKISFSDIQKIANRRVLTIGILESDNQQRQYIQNFFSQSIQEDGVRRSYFTFSLANSSKIIFLFKFTRKNLETYFTEQNRRKIDLVVYFEKGWNIEDNFNNLHKIPQNVMIKKINQKEVDELLQLNKLSGLDLAQFPIVYKQDNLNKLFELLWITFENPELGYCKSALADLKQLNKSKWSDMSNLLFFGGFALAGGLYAIKTYIRSKN